jgi:hypothetical protein
LSLSALSTSGSYLDRRSCHYCRPKVQVYYIQAIDEILKGLVYRVLCQTQRQKGNGIETLDAEDSSFVLERGEDRS